MENYTDSELAVMLSTRLQALEIAQAREVALAVGPPPSAATKTHAEGGSKNSLKRLAPGLIIAWFIVNPGSLADSLYLIAQYFALAVIEVHWRIALVRCHAWPVILFGFHFATRWYMRVYIGALALCALYN
ncbi:hypothetical protein FRC12_003284 [Ceratobasidium sp. 428]|nr:hypothetical protein FRC12_003284 [Ceratobasidium sp. 428]